MRKLAIGALLAIAPAISFAHPAGCGLGTEVIFKQPSSWVEHVLAATTNGTSGNQTFGMTSGTLGCEDANGPLASRVNLFLNSNLEQVAMDSARGEGESLSALASLIGIDGADSGMFKSKVQANFDELFTDTNSNPTSVYNALVSMMEADETLSKYLS